MAEHAEGGKKQFNVYLSPELIRRAKYRALDEQTSLSGLVQCALEQYLDRRRSRDGEPEG